MADHHPWLQVCVLCVGLSLTLGAQHPSTDSIMDIINIKEVERLLAARRENISKEERRFLGKNALDEDELTEPEDKEDDDFFYTDPDDEFRQQLNITGFRKIATKQVSNVRKSPTVNIETLIRKNNETYPNKTPEILGELGGYTGDKLLKSSKNALLVTKKEYLKRDWCKTEHLFQKVREDGCITRTVVNRFCYGQCNSFYIPKSPRRRRSRRRDSDEEEDESDAPAFKSCSFCKPKKSSWITVTLNCPSLNPQLRKKRILRIKQCKCIAEVFN
ncbi:hypothetical protein L9F63_005013 [Diploptera punctata]|uniref:CTCK domain-containing protein n=1 Tax=Diploptera punctata TaxID=6984 RepID=A0AAD8E664_DIPPU|nr:hypothetical protein L9F63_005013 [Diploptera punctata]